MKWRVLISAPYLLPVIEEFRPLLEAAGIEILRAAVNERLSEEQLIPLVKTIDGVICGDDQFTEKILRLAPRLKVISKWGTGIDSIAHEAAAKFGIKVYNTPDAFTDAVADTVLGYMLCFARRLPWMDHDIREGLWIKQKGVSLRECTLGVIGVGNIGRAVTRRARAFGMTVIGNDPAAISASFIKETGIIMTSLTELFKKSDFVSLHCDLNPTSFHLINRAEFEMMRSSSYLINTSRGPVINEPALVDALQREQIAGAALDVFEIEPLPPDSPLRAFDNCLLAPHNSNSSPVAKQRVHKCTIANLLRGLQEAEIEHEEIQIIR